MEGRTNGSRDGGVLIMDTKPETGLVRQAPRNFSLLPSSLGEAREMAEMIARSDFAPKDYKGKPENVIIAVQMGADLGLKPMQALQNIAVINGRPPNWQWMTSTIRPSGSCATR